MLSSPGFRLSSVSVPVLGNSVELCKLQPSYTLSTSPPQTQPQKPFQAYKTLLAYQSEEAPRAVSQPLSPFSQAARSISNSFTFSRQITFHNKTPLTHPTQDTFRRDHRRTRPTSIKPSQPTTSNPSTASHSETITGQAPSTCTSHCSLPTKTSTHCSTITISTSHPVSTRSLDYTTSRTSSNATPHSIQAEPKSPCAY